MITTDLTTLKINKLTKAQYEAALAAGNINENELYMTPENEGTVQSDWNVNDASSSEYIKNRPFYTGDLVETYIVQNPSFSQSTTSDDGTVKQHIFSSLIELVVGTKYTVYFGSTSYECICFLNESASCLGNSSILGIGNNTGEPFFIYTDNSTQTIIATTDTSDVPSVSISTLLSEIIKIDEKYLPVATDDSYGVVKTDRLVTFYNFDYNVPTSLLIEAVELFNQGRAAIRWYNNDVFLASISSNSIDLMFKDFIGKYYSYDKTLETSGFYQTIDVSYIDFHTECIRLYNSKGESNIDTNIYLSNDSDGKDYLNLYSLHVYDNSVELWMYSSASGSSKVVAHKFTTDDNNLMLNGKILATEDYVNKFKPTTTITTLTASNWDSTAKTYSFESTYPSASYDIEVDIDGDRCTDEQLNAWIAAKPLSSSTNKIVAKGDIPVVDIPIILTVTPK